MPDDGSANWDRDWEDNASAPHDDEPPRPPSEGIVPLGHDRGVYYYLSRSAGQVIALPAERHSRNALMSMASVAHHWQRTKFVNKKGDVQWDDAIDSLMRDCRDVGIYNPDRVRGRGAWLDEGRPVLHLGDRLQIHGSDRALHLDGTQHIYEAARRLDVPLAPKLSAARASRLMDLCTAAPWEHPESMGRLLAGWCVIAPVCGAMPWRPHLWITSENGGGKSWVLDSIVKPLIGAVALPVQSKTSEAGIRQTLGSDALPVIFDEAETQNDRDRDRVQMVLDLARQASSEDGAAIIKGSSTGRAMQYRIRSCFVFSSINVGLTQAADESRTVVLTLSNSLKGDAKAAAFRRLQAIHAEVMQPDFAAGLLARTLSLLQSIRANSVVFAEAIARGGQSRRIGDTYGVLLAGAWSLRSPRIATPADADAFLVDQAWARDAVSTAKVEPEWSRALIRLLQTRERYTNQNGRTDEVAIGDLVEAAAGRGNSGITGQDAVTTLTKIGLRYARHPDVGECLFVATSSLRLDQAFDKSPWASSWLATLSRADGAKRNAANLRLAGTQTKVLAIPIKHVLGGD